MHRIPLARNLILLLVLGTALVVGDPHVTPLSADPLAHQAADAPPIYLKNRTLTPPTGVDAALRNAATVQAGERVHVLLQMDHIPSTQERAALARQGVELQTYVPEMAWVARVPAAQVPALTTGPMGIRWVGSWQVADKLSPNVHSRQFPSWTVHDTGRVQLMVLFHADVPLGEGEALAAAHGVVVAGRISYPPALTVWMQPDDIAALAAEEGVLWIEEAPPPLSELNDGARDALNVDTVQAAPYSLDGSGVNLFVFDGGRVEAHAGFSSRLTIVSGDTAGLSEHATHVAGTALGDGVGGSPPGGRDLKGMAPAANLFSAGYQPSFGTLFWDNAGDIQTDYASARNNHNVDIGTNSLGSNAASNGFDCAIEGDYGVSSALIDGIVRGDNATVGSPVLMTWANGNERTGGTPYGRCGSHFNTTGPPSCAKNPVHVGATNSDGDAMTDFSSWGPCDDGRLKPIVSGPGCESGLVTGESFIYSTTYSDTYGSSAYCGTSMATPAVAGVVTLGMQHYRAITGDSSARPPNALVKAWLIHTARDQGLSGPDYIYGYGQVDALKFVNLISDTTKYLTGTITTNGATDAYGYYIPSGSGELKVSLAWDDVAASPIISDGTSALINNLDLELVAPGGGGTHYPFSLDPANPERAATASGANTRDNQEQVVVTDPAPGVWTIRVRGTTVPQAPQSYALVHTHAGALVCGGDLVTNGDFESGGAGWALGGTVTPPTIVAAPAGGSGQALLLGGDTGNIQEYAYQQITIPATATVTSLAFNWYMASVQAEPDRPKDGFNFSAYNSTLSQVLLVGDMRSNAWKRNTWYGNDYVDLSPLAGQTINILFLSFNDATLATSFYVDDVSLVACTQEPASTDAPELSISKTVQPETNVPYHSAVTYTVVLSNTGAISATDTLFTDTLPLEMDFDSWVVQPAGAAVSNDEITWSGTVTNSQAITFTFTASHVGDYGETVTNTARFQGALEAGSAGAVCSVEQGACANVTGVDLSLITSGAIYTDTAVQFSADVAPNAASKPYTYTVDYDDGTPLTEMASSDDPLSLGHTFFNTGTYDVVISVWNCDMTTPVTDTLQIFVNVKTPSVCEPVAGLNLSLLTAGTLYTSTLVQLAADVTPNAAAKPYTYTVDYDDGTPLAEMTSSADPLPLNHTFSSTGTYTVEVATWNCDMTIPVTDTVQVVVSEGAPPACKPVTGVNLSLLTPGTLYTSTLVQLAADIAPDAATKPYTYTVDYDDGTPLAEMASSDDPLSLGHTFSSSGTYTVEVAAWNCTMSQPVTDTVMLEIMTDNGTVYVYLPTLLRNYSP